MAALSLCVALGPTHAKDDRSDENVVTCPKQLQHRSVEQVLEAHLAAFRSGNAEQLACDYARDAIFILPGTVARGRDEIQAVFAGFFAQAGSINTLTVTSLTQEAGTALMTYKLDSQHIVVTDGVDTFLIERGRIVSHTAYLGGLSTR